MAKISAAGGPTIEGVPGLDNQSDREEDQSDFLADPESGGVPSRADRIEQAAADHAAGRDPAAEPGEPGGARTVEDNDDSASDSYEDFTYNEVQALCKQRGLPATGSHGELVARLRAADQAD